MSDHCIADTQDPPAWKRNAMDRATARAKSGEVMLKSISGDTFPILGFTGIKARFPAAVTTWGETTISWSLLLRVAEGKTEFIGV